MRERAIFLGKVLFVGIACVPACKDRTPYTPMEVVVEGMLHIKLEIKHDSSAIVARLVFTNPSDKEVRVLKRNLLYKGRMTFGAFKVTRDGEKIPYIGMSAKRGPPTRDDWYLLESGQSYETTIRISDEYDFSTPGEYEVQYHAYHSDFTGKLPLFESNIVKILIPK